MTQDIYEERKSVFYRGRLLEILGITSLCFIPFVNHTYQAVGFTIAALNAFASAYILIHNFNKKLKNHDTTNT